MNKLKSFSYPYATAGGNEDGEVSLENSASIGLEFLNNNRLISNNKIEVNNLKKPIEFYISRDPSVIMTPFQLINLTSYTTGSNALFTVSINVTNKNASIHFQLKPSIEILKNQSVGYLALLKFGDIPILTENTRSYDYWKLFCPLGFFF